MTENNLKQEVPEYEIIEGELKIKINLSGEEIEIKRKLDKEQMVKVMEVLENDR